MKILLAISVIAVLANIDANAQAVRFDSIATTTNSACAPGANCPLLVVPGTAVVFCGGNGLGVANTAGTVVTATSGPSFTGASGSIQIAGTTYQISVVVSSTVLITTTSAGTQTGAITSTKSGCAANPATTYTGADAGTPCATTAQLTPASGGACASVADKQGNYGAWFLAGNYYFYLTQPASAGGNVSGPYPISIGASTGCPSNGTCDANYATLKLADTAAGTGTLYCTKAWNGLPNETLSSNITALGTCKLQAASGQTVTVKSVLAGSWALCDQSLGTVSVTSANGVYYPGWECTVPESAPITALTQGIVADPIPGSSSTPYPSSPVLCPGGAITMAAATVAGGQSYLIPNWCFGQAGGTVNTSGTSVTWVSGVHYRTFRAGEVETINGGSCTVAASPAPTFNTFSCTASQGTHSGVALLTDANDRYFRSGQGGVVNVASTAVTWVSGVTFGDLAVGNIVSINDSQCTIASISNSTNMACVENLGSLSGSTMITGAGSCFLGFGISSPGSTDIVPGQLKIGCSQTGLAGDHITWNEKMSFYGNGDAEHTFPGGAPETTFGWRLTTPGALGGLFVDTFNTIATPGLTALNTVLSPGLPSISVLTGNENTLALEMAFDGGGNFYMQGRDFLGDSTAHKIILNALGGDVNVGPSNAEFNGLLNVNGVTEATGFYSVADGACSTANFGIYGATNSLKEFLTCLNTSTNRTSLTSILQMTGLLPIDLIDSLTTSGPFNYIASETGSNNAIVGNIAQQAAVAGLEGTILLAHTLQAGANNFTYNGNTYGIKKHTNPATDIGTAYAVGGILHWVFDGTVMQDLSQ